MHIPRTTNTMNLVAKDVYMYRFDASTKKLQCLGRCDILEPDEWLCKKGIAKFITKDGKYYYTSAKDITVSNEEGIAIVHAGRIFTFWLREDNKEEAMNCAKKECKDYAQKLIYKYQRAINKIEGMLGEYLKD